MKFIGAFVSGAMALSAEDNNSFTKIVEVCSDMTTQFTQEKKDAEVLLAKESTQYSMEIQNLNTEIGQQTENENSARSAKESCEAKSAASADKSNELLGSIDLLNKDLKNSLGEHDNRQTSCAETTNDLRTRAESLQLARTTLTTQHKELSLVQINKIRSLVGQAPQATVKTYESGLKPLIDLVTKLQEETSAGLTEHNTACTNDAHSYNLLKTDLTNEVAQKTEAEATASNDKAVADQCAAEEKQNEDESKASLATANDMLSKTKTTKKTREGELNQQINELASTLDGLGQITELLADVDAGANNLATVPGTFLVQLFSAPVADKVSQFLMKRGAALNAPALSTLATKVSATSFDNVKQMIKDLISNLNKQAQEDTSLDQLCKGQQEENAHNYAELNDQADTASTNIEKGNAHIELLSGKISDLSTSITTLAEEQAAHDEDRLEEKTENERIISEGNTAVAALEQIIEIVKEKVVGEAAQGRLMPIFKDMHMNVIRLVEETEMAEDTSKTDHEDMTISRNTDTKAHEANKLNTQSKLETTKGDVKDNEEKLDTAKHGLTNEEKIQAATAQRCNPQQTHEQKMADVQEQIESLNEALEIIKNA